MQQPADIRNLSARRPASAPCRRAAHRPRNCGPICADAVEPITRRFGPPKMVTREHTNNAVRWKPGERLNHVLEEACIRFAESDAVVTDARTLTLSRSRLPRQPGRAPSDRSGHSARRPRRAVVRQVGRNLHRDAGGDEGACRLRAARCRVPDRAHPLHHRRCRDQRDRLDGGLRGAPRAARGRKVFLDRPSARSTAKAASR